MNRITLVAILLASTLLPRVVSAQFTGMKYRIPLDANTVVLINAEKMFGSEISDKDRWAERRQAAYDAGILALPPDATEVVMSGRLDHEFGESVWELAMVKLNADRNVTTVAARYGGTVDDIVGRSAARLPNDKYVVQLMGNLLASYTPANRQDVSRWLRSTDTGSKKYLQPYLERAFGYAEKVGTPIVMAADLKGMFSPAMVKEAFNSFESLKDSGISPDDLVKLMQGVHGITLGVTLTDNAYGAVRVDFEDSPELLSKVGKDLLIESLQRHGAMIDDFLEWEPVVTGNTFMLKGLVSDSGARRMLSLLELPRSLSDSMKEASSPGADQEGKAVLLATQQYWKTVTTLLDDLRMKPKRDHVKTFGQAAIWYDKYARKIDGLPIMNVDDEMLDFGMQISSALRDGEMAMKGVGMRTSQRTASNQPTSGGYGYSFGGYRAGNGYTGGLYGGGGYTASVGAGRASLQAKGQSDAIIRGQERTQGAATVQNLWVAIDESTAQMRRKMVGKYSADF
jgi:hypothetical protein